MNNKQEVEIRAFLVPEQRRGIEQKIEEMGGSIEKHLELTDVYFCNNNVKLFAEIEMCEVGSYSLRIRKSSEGGRSEIVELNTKVITQHDDHNAWEEHEIQLDSFEEGRAILRAIGFKEFFTVEKARTVMRLNECTIALEDVKNFGPIIEVEIMTTQAKAEEAKKKIRELLAILGVKEDQIVAKSVTNLLMRKWAKFS